jgi:D-tyrosyl-tRNA(Tyr) deacylase
VRALVQVVTSASVAVSGEVLGAIDGPGLVVLVGATHSDTADHASRLADKVWNLRVMDDEKSACDLAAPLLVVSQFTLYADLNKGRRPSWSAAAPREVSEPLVTAFCDALRERGARVETGRFGADMQVSLVNDGPRTILVEV